MKFNHNFDVLLNFFEGFKEKEGGLLGDISVDDGETVRYDLNALNGNITIGSNCKVHGRCNTVNGNINVGKNSNVEDLNTVNGRIEIGENGVVKDDISSVNGFLKTDSGVKIEKNIKFVIGSICLSNTIVKQDIRIHSGNVSISNGSIVNGDIIVKRTRRYFSAKRHVQIEIGDNSTVKGDIVVRDENTDAEVILSESGKVEGDIINAEVIHKSNK